MKRVIEHLNIFGMRLDMVQIPEVIEIIQGWIENKNCHNYITLLTANEAVLGRRDAKARDTVNCSSLAVPDGISLILFSRLCGHNLKRRVYGPELLIEFLKTTEGKNYSHYFYGSTDEVLQRLVSGLKKKFPKLKVAGAYAPSFAELATEEEIKIINTINSLHPDVLWVGLGGIKQQLWMYRNKDKLQIPAMIGVGAAFDFIAGTKPQAPAWMRNNGLEWLFRLVTEPKRLWRRYLINGSLFVFYLIKELLIKRVSRQKD